MAKRYRDGECCGGCGMSGLTLDREGLCCGCWEAKRAHENAEREIYGVELVREPVLPMGPMECGEAPGPLCVVPWGLTSPVLVARRMRDPWLF